MSKASEEARNRLIEVKKGWQVLSNTPTGKCIIEDLEKKFAPPSMIKKKNGVVDPYATLSANGAFEVISYIRSMINE